MKHKRYTILMPDIIQQEIDAICAKENVSQDKVIQTMFKLFFAAQKTPLFVRLEGQYHQLDLFGEE